MLDHSSVMKHFHPGRLVIFVYSAILNQLLRMSVYDELGEKWR
jgi:hypothetical protein